MRLLEGYFLPPPMFTQGEASSLLVGLTFQRSLQATPFPAERELAEKKLLAALPDRLRAMLAKAEKLIGFEQLPHDIFHPEPALPLPPATAAPTRRKPWPPSTRRLILQRDQVRGSDCLNLDHQIKILAQ